MWTAARSLAARLKPADERRRAGRLKATSLRCNRGTVMDISATGLRLRSWSRYTGTLDVKLCVGSRCVTLRAEVVWSKRLSFRKHEHGLAFRDITPELTQELRHIAFYLSNG